MKPMMPIEPAAARSTASVLRCLRSSAASTAVVAHRPICQKLATVNIVSSTRAALGGSSSVCRPRNTEAINRNQTVVRLATCSGSSRNSSCGVAARRAYCLRASRRSNSSTKRMPNATRAGHEPAPRRITQEICRTADSIRPPAVSPSTGALRRSPALPACPRESPRRLRAALSTASGCWPRMPSRRIAVIVTSSRSSFRSASVLPTQYAPGGSTTVCSSSLPVSTSSTISSIVATEQPPQHRIAIVADVADCLDHARYRHVEQQQHVRHQHEARFQRLRHDLRGAGLLQLLQLRVVLRAHQDRQLRAQLAHRPDDLHRSRCAPRTSARARGSVRDRRLPASRSPCRRRRSPHRRRAAPARRRADPNRARRTRSPVDPARARGFGRRGRSRR